MMSISMIGIDHNKADVDIRSLFSFTKKSTEEALQYWKSLPGIQGCIILSTCNRMEIWVSENEARQGSLTEELCEYKNLNPAQYGVYFTARKDEDAIGHLFHLTSGLKSMILAEDQIITQVKDALAFAREHYATDNVLEVLFRRAITAGKRVKTEVIFSHANQTAMDQAIELLRRQNYKLERKKCLVIGNGEMGKLAANSLVREGADVTVTVRQYRSGIVSIPQGCKRINYGERAEAISSCDLIVSATSSPNYTITRELVYKAVGVNRLKRKITLIDLAVPRDIEPAIGKLPGVKLYTIDDFRLDDLTEENRRAMEHAEIILQEEINEFYIWYRGKDLIPRIQNLQKEAAQDLLLRLKKPIRKLSMDKEEEAALLQAIETSAEKVIGKLIYGIRDQVETDTLISCVEGMEKTYEE